MATKSTRAARQRCIDSHGAYHSVEDIYQPTYHVNADCPRGEQILAENLRCGTGKAYAERCKDC